MRCNAYVTFEVVCGTLKVTSHKCFCFEEALIFAFNTYFIYLFIFFAKGSQNACYNGLEVARSLQSLSRAAFEWFFEVGGVVCVT